MCGAKKSISISPLDMEGLGKALNLLRLLGGANAPERFAAKMGAMTSRLAAQQVVGSAGGGMLRVTLTGGRQCVAVEIDPTLVGKQVVLQDLARVAINDALKKVGEAEAKEQSAAVKEMLADLPALLKELAGGLPDGAAAAPGGGQAGRGSHLR